ncbi:UDP-N-acetylmuramoyl-L-alanyl-D-glutamate--2,6-diaminopimelate ligase [Planomicrobium sp. MB-3u-38]|uniref:UDP-N-acetylmuramoyl-L-alanyl-D-glutamate--2, 6-diaminopimelate ligase n=1 Tax=Planomicrobium sp. MB-3u-38 TaxID=2058318 RepID=UPI000C7C147B|nr:UDP-N-acetylmuramoyl-L-alanyl-D-glutamate--2,6-diaminopimelate ligase [Planomicrobium sp. MB-3u-38]PKH09953.1 UDP-N-acetylmuramoyl-L-alanyl-D-glutamate--2,6-diaminopimelate ligase [Planomicrobium sp. MB-3u-38]
MKLTQLIKGLIPQNSIEEDLHDLVIKGIADSSQEVEEGFVFIAIKGYKDDGHNHIAHAIQKGATLIVGEQELEELPIPYLRVENARMALGILSKNFYGNPASGKLMIGITGTNGKTTTSYLVKHLLEQNGITCSVMGTIQNIVNGESIKSANTTPSSLILQKLLAESHDDAVVMEVSSHGLTQHRIEGIEFDVCMFTNLHHEHLDYHGSMESYYEAKSILFEHLKPTGTAIINTDDEWGEKLDRELRAKGRDVWSIGQAQHSRFRIESFDMEHSTLCLAGEEKTLIQSPMAGIHNIYNSLMAYAAALAVGVKKDDILSSIKNFPGVEGRFETSKTGKGVIVIVDYAHTPDAVFHCLTTAKEAGANQITHIFGFRGDRDSSKRREMIEITSNISDRYIITTDDLNSVPAEEMQLHYIELNEQYGNEKGLIQMDRTRAIKDAIDSSSEGDWVVITGKGHEKYSHQFELPTESDKETVKFMVEPPSAE